MTTKKTGGNDPQDVREDRVRWKRDKAEAMVRLVAMEADERVAKGLPFVGLNTWLNKVALGKNDESFLDMIWDFGELLLSVEDDFTEEERKQLFAMNHNIRLETMRMWKQNGEAGVYVEYY